MVFPPSGYFPSTILGGTGKALTASARRLKILELDGPAAAPYIEVKPSPGKVWVTQDMWGSHNDTSNATLQWGWTDGKIAFAKPGVSVAAGVMVPYVQTPATGITPVELTISPECWVTFQAGGALSGGKVIYVQLIYFEFNEGEVVS